MGRQQPSRAQRLRWWCVAPSSDKAHHRRAKNERESAASAPPRTPRTPPRDAASERGKERRRRWQRRGGLRRRQVKKSIKRKADAGRRFRSRSGLRNQKAERTSGRNWETAIRRRPRGTASSSVHVVRRSNHRRLLQRGLRPLLHRWESEHCIHVLTHDPVLHGDLGAFPRRETQPELTSRQAGGPSAGARISRCGGGDGCGEERRTAGAGFGGGGARALYEWKRRTTGANMQSATPNRPKRNGPASAPARRRSVAQISWMRWISGSTCVSGGEG